MKNSIFARFARAFFIFWHFEDALVLSTTWNDLFCSCVDDVSIWWEMFNFVLLCPESWFQFNSRIVTTHFSSKMTLNNRKMIAETRSYIFRWRSRFRRRRVCLSSLYLASRTISETVTLHLCNHSSLVTIRYPCKMHSNHPGIKSESALEIRRKKIKICRDVLKLSKTCHFRCLIGRERLRSEQIRKSHVQSDLNRPL